MSIRTSRRVRSTAAVATVGGVLTAWAALGAGGTEASAAPPAADAPGYQVSPIFTPGSLKTDHGFPLSQPDDLVAFDHSVFVAFQNGVGPVGQAAANGNSESSLLQLTTDGAVVAHWDLAGKIDGLGVDPDVHAVVATVDEDGSSSVYTVAPRSAGAGVTHYCYDHDPLPHGGGTDAVSYYQGRLVISASAPNPAPADVPAVYAAALLPHAHPTNCPAGTAPATGTAAVTNGFSDTAAATPGDPGAPSKLALTDPDSNTVVPGSSPRFSGEFMLDSQGDDQQIYASDPTGGSQPTVLQLDQSVNDTAFVTSGHGVLYVTDPSANSVDEVSGPFRPGDVVVSATPCSDNNAPSSCPGTNASGQSFGANYLASLDLSTGHVSPLVTALQPQGVIFVEGGGHGRGDQGQGDQGRGGSG